MEAKRAQKRSPIMKWGVIVRPFPKSGCRAGVRPDSKIRKVKRTRGMEPINWSIKSLWVKCGSSLLL
jgi:hypothetical protein